MVSSNCELSLLNPEPGWVLEGAKAGAVGRSRGGGAVCRLVPLEVVVGLVWFVMVSFVR